MKKVEIEIPEGKKAVWIGGVLTLVDDNPKDITERIKTFEDACNELGEYHPCVAAWNEYKNTTMNCESNTAAKDITAYLKLRIICAALNEGWQPQFTKDEYRYYPWFRMYTQKEIDEMEYDEHNRVLARYSYGANASSGVAYLGCNYDSSGAYSFFGTRLSLKNEELARYAGQQFIEIYADFLL